MSERFNPTVSTELLDKPDEQAPDDVLEIDSRTNDGIEVIWIWSKSTNEAWIHVLDSKQEETFTLPVAPESALDAFNHPFSVAAQMKIEPQPFVSPE